MADRHEIVAHGLPDTYISLFCCDNTRTYRLVWWSDAFDKPRTPLFERAVRANGDRYNNVHTKLFSSEAEVRRAASELVVALRLELVLKEMTS